METEPIAPPPPEAEATAAPPPEAKKADAPPEFETPPEIAAPLRATAPADEILSVTALADRLTAVAPTAGLALAVLIAGDASGLAGGLALAMGRRLSARGRVALVDLGDAPDRLSEATIAASEEELAGLAELLDGRATFEEALHRDRASSLDLIPAGVGVIDVETLGAALATLAANYDFLVMHAYDWRSPAAHAARDGVAALAIAAPSTRLETALAEARRALADESLAVVGLGSGEPVSVGQVA